jgi:hypothetical protein
MQEAINVGAKRRAARPNIRLLVLGAASLAATALLVAGVYFWVSGGEEEPSVRVITGVQFPYPPDWTEQPLSQDDRSAGLILKLERDDPEATFLARTVIARLAVEFDINQLAGDTATALENEIAGFDLLTSSVTPIGSLQTVQLQYRQDDGESTYQTLMTIIPLENQTFYLTARTEDSSFGAINADALQLISTFANYVSAASER